MAVAKVRAKQQTLTKKVNYELLEEIIEGIKVAC